MEQQKVKLQVSCDLEDVNTVVASTLDEGLGKLMKLDLALREIRNALNKSSVTDKDMLLKILKQLDDARLFLIKVDNRMADTASVVSGLVQMLEQPSQENQETNDSVKSG